MTNAPRKPGRPKGSKSKTPGVRKRSPGAKTLEQSAAEGKFAPRPTYKKMGAPKVYQPQFAEQAKILYENGATNIEVAEFFNVSTKTIQRWLLTEPDFRLCSYLGRDAANKRVEASLYNRAVGYSYEAEKIALDAKSGAVSRVTYIEHVPPDPGAAVKWLANRDPENWREKVEQHHTGEITLLDLVRASFEVKAPAELPAPDEKDPKE